VQFVSDPPPQVDTDAASIAVGAFHRKRRRFFGTDYQFSLRRSCTVRGVGSLRFAGAGKDQDRADDGENNERPARGRDHV
jgi:hypothetical protein